MSFIVVPEDLTLYCDISMEFQSVPIEIKSCTYLGIRDRILIAGNGPSTQLVLYFSKYKNEVMGDRILRKITQFDVHNSKFAAMELCGVPRLGQTFVALAYCIQSSRQTCCEIKIIRVQTDLESGKLTECAPFDMKRSGSTSVFKSQSSYTSLSFLSDLELLAAANEAGEVIIWDFFSGIETLRVKVDPTGISQLKFNRKNQLITLGYSKMNNIKIWNVEASVEVNVSHSRKVNTSLNCFKELTANRSNKNQSWSNFSSITLLTCFAFHSVEDKLVVGNSDGTISFIDLRDLTSLEIKSCNSMITDIMFHPRYHDVVLLTSSDGTLRSINLNALNSRSQLNEEKNPIGTILSEHAPIKKVDVDIETGCIIAVTTVGGIFQIS